MIRTLLSTCILCAIISCKQTEIPNYNGEYDLSLMSFNLRYDEEADGENKWSNRQWACIDMLKEFEPSLLGIQEGQEHQVNFLAENLDDYAHVGEKNESSYYGEYKSIFYKKAQFDLLQSETFWLSETPEVQSLGWDSNNIRIVTWAKLYDKHAGKILYVFNTHFDHIGKVAQQKSSELLVEKVSEIVEAGAPVFITGDFNMLVGNKRLAPITNEFLSAQHFAEKSDDNQSFNAFGRWYLNRNIDFIFFKKANALSYKTVVKDYGVPYISDHYPIISHMNY